MDGAVDESAKAYFAERSARNAARRRREANHAILAAIAPIVAACDRFALHLDDATDRAVQAWAEANVPPSGPFEESHEAGVWGDSAALRGALTGLVGRRRLSGVTYVMAGFGGGAGRDPTIAIDAADLGALVPELRDAAGTAIAGLYAECWIVQPAGGWAIRVHHGGTIDFVGPAVCPAPLAASA
jgi:hypothetical protein